MKIIKFLGKLLSIPFGITLWIVLLSTFPLKLINNWLKGYGKYNRIYLTFAKDAIKKAWHAALRKEHPVLKSLLMYEDKQEVIILENNRVNPIVHTAIPNEVITITN